MKHFIIKGFYFLFRFIFVFIVAFFIYLQIIGITYQNSPALNFSDSYSFNEKIEFIKKHDLEPKVITVGSSMALSSLHSDIVIENMHTKEYLNTASWGSSMGDNFNFIKLLVRLYHPQKILISSNYIDFQQGEKKINYDWVESYLTSDYYHTVSYFITSFDKQYYERNFEYAKRVRFSRNNYETLDYDQYGMVRFDTLNFNISKEIWNKDYFTNQTREEEYIYLDSISTYCKTQNIQLLFFNTPFRDGIWTEDKENKKNIQQTHVAKIRNIVEKNNHIFIDSSVKDWNDSLFIDPIHFNERGAKAFTRFCFSQLK